jgi:ferredoxin
MKAIVEPGCISCGLCISTCPEVFRFGSDGLAEAYEEVTDKLEDSAQEARDGCPVSVITIKED